MLRIPGLARTGTHLGMLAHPAFRKLPWPARQGVGQSITEGATEWGMREAVLLEYDAWGFRVDEIAPMPMKIWQGRRDSSIPLASTIELAAHLPNPVLAECEDDHLGIYPRHVDDVLSWVAHLDWGGG